jgi:hypothetical protein
MANLKIAIRKTSSYLLNFLLFYTRRLSNQKDCDKGTCHHDDSIYSLLPRGGVDSCYYIAADAKCGR